MFNPISSGGEGGGADSAPPGANTWCHKILLSKNFFLHFDFLYIVPVCYLKRFLKSFDPLLIFYGLLKKLSWIFWKLQKLRKAIFWKNTSPNQKSEENRPPKTTQKTDLIDRARLFWPFSRELWSFFKITDPADHHRSVKNPFRLFFCKSIFFLFFQPKNQILCIQTCKSRC